MNSVQHRLCPVCDSIMHWGVCWPCAERDMEAMSGVDEWYKDDYYISYYERSGIYDHVTGEYVYDDEPDYEWESYTPDPPPLLRMWWRARSWWRDTLHDIRMRVDRGYRKSYNEVPF